jgi:type IV pilus biogenesis protein PilP
MAPEKKTKEGLAGMPTKQKVMAGVVGVIMIVIIWQVFQMFGGGASAPPENTPQTANMTAAQPGNMAAGAPGGAPGAAAPAAAPVQPAVKDSNVPSSEFLEAQKETQAKYVSALNDLQMMRLEKEKSDIDQSIAASKQAIATANLAKLKAETEMRDIITKPVVNMPASGYAGQLEGGAQAGSIPGAPPTQISQAVVAEPQYVVISVSMQFNKWTAVLGSQGKLFNVSVGDVLPDDGSMVMQISKNGVVLKTKNGGRKKVSLVSSI